MDCLEQEILLETVLVETGGPVVDMLTTQFLVLLHINW